MNRRHSSDRLSALLAALLVLLSGLAPAAAARRDSARLDELVSGCCVAPAAACCPEREAAPVPRILPSCCGVDAPPQAPPAAPRAPLQVDPDDQARCRERVVADARASARTPAEAPSSVPRTALVHDPWPAPASRGAPASLLHRRAQRGGRAVLAQLSIARI